MAACNIHYSFAFSLSLLLQIHGTFSLKRAFQFLIRSFWKYQVPSQSLVASSHIKPQSKRFTITSFSRSSKISIYSLIFSNSILSWIISITSSDSDFNISISDISFPLYLARLDHEVKHPFRFL